MTRDPRAGSGNRDGRRSIALVVLALVGVAISSILAAYQLGITSGVWDPLFGNGSERVLTSSVSRALPVPDATLGVAGYAVDGLLGVLLVARIPGGTRIATLLAAVAVVGAIVAIGLAIAQPLVAHAGCSLCLASTAVSIALAAGAVAEARDRRHERTEPAGAPRSERSPANGKEIQP